MERAVSRSEEEQVLVAQAEERPPESREHRQLVVGPLDRGERHPHRFDLLALMEASSSHENVGDVERRERRRKLGDRRPKLTNRRNRRQTSEGATGREPPPRELTRHPSEGFLEKPADPGGHRLGLER
jgi:hypothetical protein